MTLCETTTFWDSQMFGVIIGALVAGGFGLLTPYLIHQINKGKRQKTFQHELISTLYLWFSYYKLHVVRYNNLEMYGALLGVGRMDYYEALNMFKPEIQKVLDSYTKSFDELDELVDEVFDKLTELESKLIALDIEGMQLLGRRKFKPIRELLSPYARRVDNQNELRLYNYKNLQAEEVKAKAKKIGGELELKTQEISRKGIELIEKLELLF